MTIYTSEKVMPYVYWCTHKETGEFYIGSRTSTKLTVPSHLDFPKYKTSSKRVKPRFDEFDWHIVAEFFSSQDAYDYEQQLIFENWGNPLRLNNFYTMGGKRMWGCDNLGRKHPNKKPRKTGWKLGPMSDDTKRKLSEAKKGITQGPNPLKANAGEKNGMFGRSRTEEEKQKIRETRATRTKEQDLASYSRKKTTEEIQKIRDHRPDTHGAENPNAKNIIITTPSGSEIMCCGNFRETCTRLGVKWETMRGLLWSGRTGAGGASRGYSVRYG